MSNDQIIAAEIKAGLAEAATATGAGELICVIRRNDPNAETAEDPIEAEAITVLEPVYFEITAVQTAKSVRDRGGELTGVTMRMLLVDATGVVPLKSDTIAINLRSTDVTDGTVFEVIQNIKTTGPASAPLLHTITLKD